MDIRRHVPDFFRKRYARKFAVVGLLVIALVVTIGWVTQAQISNRLTEDKRTTVRTNAELEATSLGQWLEGQKQLTRSLSKNEGLQSDNRATIRSELDAELREMPREVAALHYVGRENQTVVASTNRSVEGKSLDTNESIEGSDLTAAEVYWNPSVGFTFQNDSDVLESFVYVENDEPTVALASPVPDSDHVAVTIIRTNVRASEFSSAIDGTRTVAIGGFTGLLLFSENASEVLTSYSGAKNSTVEQRVLDPNVSNTGSLTTGDEIVGYASVSGTDWVVVKETPKSEALSLQPDIQESLLLLIAVALWGLLLLNFLTARGPMRSLRQLATQASAIARGDLSTEIADQNRIDEVGAVRSSLRDIKSFLDTAAAQSEALANQEFDDPVLDENLPGPLGEAFKDTRTDLERLIKDLEATRQEAERSRQDTEQKNEQLRVLDRLLRHNIKNDMNIIRLHAELARQEENEEHIQKILEMIDDILETTEKERTITKLLSAETDHSAVDIVSVVERVVATLTDTHSHAEVSVDLPASPVYVQIPYIEAAVRELLENAIVHCDRTPRVEITVVDMGSTVRLRVVDNGPGIPETDQRVLLGRQDIDPLEHGTGIGLWLVYWTVHQSAELIQCEDTDPHGSVITLELETVPDGDA